MSHPDEIAKVDAPDRVAHQRMLLKIRAQLSAGATALEIAERLRLTPEKAETLIGELYSLEQRRVAELSPEVVAVRHAIMTEESLRALDEIASESRRGRQPAAAAGAIKLKHALFGEHIELLQSLGMLSKKADAKANEYQTMTTDQLVMVIATKRNQTESLIRATRSAFEDEHDDERPAGAVIVNKVAPVATSPQNDEPEPPPVVATPARTPTRSRRQT